MVAAWLTGSVFAPITAVLSASGDLGGQAWGAKLRDPHGEVKAPSPRQEPRGGPPSGPRAALGGTTGRAASSSRSGSSTALDVPDVDGGLLAILATEYADGSAAEYAIPARVRPAGAVEAAQPTDPVWAALARLAANGGSVEGEQGVVVGTPARRPERDIPWRDCRPLEADQSNTSVVVDGLVVLKLYRRLRRGPIRSRSCSQG